MSKVKRPNKTMEKAEILVESIHGLKEMLKSIEGVAKEAEIDDSSQRLRLPYVSAQPIRRSGWNS